MVDRNPEGRRPTGGPSGGGGSDWFKRHLGIGKYKYDLLNKIGHLDKSKLNNEGTNYIEKARQLNQEYQKIRGELEILTRDHRVENFRGKTQAQIRADYNALPQEALTQGKTNLLECERDLKNYQTLKDQMKRHIEQVTAETANGWKESFLQTSSDLDKLEQDIDPNYGDLITQEQRNKLKLANDRKLAFQKLREDYSKIGEVAVGDDHEQQMDQALQGFREATDAAKPILEELKEARAQTNPTFHEIDTRLLDLNNELNNNYTDIVGIIDIVSRERLQYRQDNATKFRKEAVEAINDGQNTQKIDDALLNFQHATDDVRQFRDTAKEWQARLQEPAGSHGHLRVFSDGGQESSSESTKTQAEIDIEEYISGKEPHVALNYRMLGTKPMVEQWIETIQSDYTPIIGITNDLSRERLDYRYNNVIDATFAARTLINERGKASSEEGQTELHKKMNAANLRLELAGKEVKMFLDDLGAMSLPKRLGYAETKFNEAKDWIEQNVSLVDEAAAGHARLRDKVINDLGKLSEYQEYSEKSSANELNQIKNFPEKLYNRLVEAEELVQEYVKFKEDLQKQ